MLLKNCRLATAVHIPQIRTEISRPGWGGDKSVQVYVQVRHRVFRTTMQQNICIFLLLICTNPFLQDEHNKKWEHKWPLKCLNPNLSNCACKRICIFQAQLHPFYSDNLDQNGFITMIVQAFTHIEHCIISITKFLANLKANSLFRLTPGLSKN